MRRPGTRLSQQRSCAPLPPTRTGAMVWCLVLATLPLCFSALPAAAQSPPTHARGMSFEPWSLQDCLGRAKQALQVEGYTITWTGGDGYLGEKGANSAFVLCDDGPPGRVLVNIVVASNAADRNTAPAERDRLGRRLGHITMAGGGNPGLTNWTKTANEWRGRNGERFTLTCEANGAIASDVWGSDVYTDDSVVCVAAVHAGLITAARGGPVTIEIRPGQSAYTSTERNGLKSRVYGTWPGSFVFIR